MPPFFRFDKKYDEFSAKPCPSCHPIQLSDRTAEHIGSSNLKCTSCNI